MATGVGTGFSLDFSKAIADASKLDSRIETMVNNSKLLQQNMSQAFSGANTSSFLGILDRLSSDFKALGDKKVSPNFDTSKAENLMGIINNIVTTMQYFSKAKVELFDTQNIYATNKGLLTAQDNFASITNKMKELRELWNKIQEAKYAEQKFEVPKFEPLINEKTGKPYGGKTQAQQQHRAEYDEKIKLLKEWENAYNKHNAIIFEQERKNSAYAIELEMRELIEKRAIASKELQWANMTQDQKTAYIQKELNKQLASEQKHINEVRKEYQKLVSDQIDIMRKGDKLNKSGIGSEGNKISAEYERQYLQYDARRKQIEAEYGSFLVAEMESANRKVLDIETNRIKQRQSAEKAAQEEQWQWYLKSPEGALTLAKDAKTLNDMKEAQKYLQEARGRVDISDTSTIKKLNDEYTRLRGEIEKLTTAEKNEQSLQPTLRNEYSRLLKELDKVKKARMEMAQTEAFKSKDSATRKSYADLVAREQDLNRKIYEIRRNTGNLVAEVERKHAADVAMVQLSETQKVEQQKLELARKRMAQELAQSSKYGTISSSSANRLISITDNAKNIQQEQQAIQKLQAARASLSKEDANYKTTLETLNAKIKEHEHNIKMATDATYRKNQADKEAQKKNTTYQGALDYSKNTKSINEQIKAIQYLKEARNKLDRGSMSQKEYEKQVKTLTDEIKRQQRELDKLKGKQEEVGNSQERLTGIGGQLQRQLALVFSVSQITGYISKIVQVRGEFELQQKALQAIVQNVDEANELWSKTVDLAVKSPFRVKELVTYTKQLAAYRIETDKLYDTTKMLADVSAGLGVDMQRLILAYGQVKAANYLRGTELRQFSEAGINMLGELSKYFTEIENRAVSVADVFDRISKRGVSFENVDAVFQRITSAGGVFYQMQEKQAETLKGQISNLNDSYDIMMNKIGESNDSLLKGAVSLLRSMVDNWESIAAVAVPLLETLIVRWGVYKTVMLRAKLIQDGFFASMATNLRASIIYLTRGTKAFTAFGQAQGLAAKQMTSIKGNVWGIVIGVAVAAIASFTSAIIEHRQALDSITKKYDELIGKIASVSTAFRNASNDADIKKQRTELQRLVEIANTDYHMKIEVDVTGMSASELADKFNELEQQVLELNAFSSSFAKKFQETTEFVATDDIREDFSQLSTAYSNLSTEILNKKDLVLAALIPVKDTLNEVQQAAIDSLNTPIDKNETQLEYIERLKEAYVTLRKEFGKQSAKLSTLSRLYGETGKKHGEQRRELLLFLKTARLDDKTWSGLFSNFDEKTKEAKEEFKDFISAVDSDIKGLTSEEAEIKLKTAINKLAAEEEWNKFIKTTVQRWTEEYYVELGVRLVDEKDKKEDATLKAWQESYNAKFGDIPLTLDINEALYGFKKIQNAATKQSDEIERLQGEYKGVKDMIDAINKAGGIKATQKGGAYEGEDLDLWEKRLKDIQKQLDFYGADYVKKKDNKALQRLKEQIRLVRELQKDYKKLWDEQGRDVADKNIWSNERKTAFAKAGLDYTQFEVGGDDSEVKNLEKLTDISGELDKAIYDARTELGLFQQQLADADFARYLEDLLGGYEISLELEKLNIPSDLAKGLFGIDSTSLSEVRKKGLKKAGLGVLSDKSDNEILNSKYYLRLNKDQQKEVERFLKQVSDLEDKELKERLKRYSQFLVKGQSEAVKVKIQELRDLKKLEEDYNSKKMNISKPEYQRMIEGIKKESNDKIAKLSFDDFQDSTMYKKLFSDIKSVGTKSIDLVLNHLYKLRDAMKDVPPEVFAKLQERIDELEKLKIERNPFKGLEDVEDTIKDVKKERETYTDEDDKEVKLKGEDALNYKLIKNEEEIQQENEKLQILYQIKEANGDIEALKLAGLGTNTQALHLLGKEDAINQEILDTQKNINNLQGQNKGIDKQLRDYAKAKAQILSIAESWLEVIEMTKKAVDSTKQIFIALGADSDSATMDIVEIGTSFLDATAQLIMFSVQMQLLEVQAQALGVTINAALGPIGWIAIALSAVASIASPLFGAHDKEKERQIQAEISLVKKLERQYQKLEKQIETAYSLDTVQATYEQAQANLDQQYEAYNRMIEAEEDKKDTDDARIEEWRQAQEDLLQQKEDLLKSEVENLGGTYDFKSATREFVDAWIDAFNETGNGLKGLENNFDEFWKNIVLNQVVMGGASTIMKQLLDEVNKALENDFTIDDEEDKIINETADTVMKQLDEFMKQSYSKWGDALTGADTGELSGLQRGISQISESTAQIIEAYLNSIRMYVYEQNSIMQRIAEAQGIDASTENPMLPQLRIIAQQTSSISELLDSISMNNGSGIGFRVYPM